MWFVMDCMDEGREELPTGSREALEEQGWKERRVEKGKSRSLEEKEEGSVLITETDGDRKDKVWEGKYIDFVRRRVQTTL